MEGLKNAVMDRCSSAHSLLSTANRDQSLQYMCVREGVAFREAILYS